MTKDEQNMFSKFCVYCQKHGHTDDECWCTRAIPPINPVINHDQTMTTNTQAEEVLAKQIAEWRKEVARLNDLIAHAEGRDSQAASIDTPEFDDLLLTYWECRNQGESYAANERAELIAYIDAKLAQARADALREAAKICDDIGQDYRDQYKGRGQYEPNNPHRADPYADGAADGAWNCEGAITSLLQPQGQADTSGLPG